jgi:hypothetical protein
MLVAAVAAKAELGPRGPLLAMRRALFQKRCVQDVSLLESTNSIGFCLFRIGSGPSSRGHRSISRRPHRQVDVPPRVLPSANFLERLRLLLRSGAKSTSCSSSNSPRQSSWCSITVSDCRAKLSSQKSSQYVVFRPKKSDRSLNSDWLALRVAPGGDSLASSPSL